MHQVLILGSGKIGRTIDGEEWSTIQISTAAGACAALDLHVQGRLPGSGFVRQEDIVLSDFLAKRFGRYFRHAASTEPEEVEVLLVPT